MSSKCLDLTDIMTALTAIFIFSFRPSERINVAL